MATSPSRPWQPEFIIIIAGEDYVRRKRKWVALAANKAGWKRFVKSVVV